MLYSSVTPEAKRIALRQRLVNDQPLMLFGAFNALTAKMIQRHGGEGVYLSGHMIAADLGLPDLGLTTLSEVAQRGAQISRMVDVPTIIDADTGFGEPLNMARTVQVLEAAGISGAHVEDQVNPKQCGHSEGIQVVDAPHAIRRISAAVEARQDPNFVIIARTDARAAIGLDEAIARGKAFRDAGADVIFPEALRGAEEYARYAEAVDAPLMVNLNEFGVGMPPTRQELTDWGVAIAVYPMTLMRMALGAVQRGIEVISREGSQHSLLDQMQTKDELYDYLGYSDYYAFDNNVFSSPARGRGDANGASAGDAQS